MMVAIMLYENITIPRRTIPPQKKPPSPPPTAQAALLSALLNIFFLPSRIAAYDGRHNVVREHHDSEEDHPAPEEAPQPAPHGPGRAVIGFTEHILPPFPHCRL